LDIRSRRGLESSFFRGEIPPYRQRGQNLKHMGTEKQFGSGSTLRRGERQRKKKCRNKKKTTSNFRWRLKTFESCEKQERRKSHKSNPSTGGRKKK